MARNYGIGFCRRGIELLEAAEEETQQHRCQPRAGVAIEGVGAVPGQRGNRDDEKENLRP